MIVKVKKRVGRPPIGEESKVNLRAKEIAKAQQEQAEEMRKRLPGGQIPLKDLPPDSVATSVQGPLEVAQATFANCRWYKRKL